MSDIEKVQLFENKKVRTAWDEEKQEWFFSIVDVCGVLTDSKDYNTSRKYWSKLKERLIAEGNQLATSFHPELDDDLRTHQYFLQMVRQSCEQKRLPQG